MSWDTKTTPAAGVRQGNGCACRGTRTPIGAVNECTRCGRAGRLRPTRRQPREQGSGRRAKRRASSGWYCVVHDAGTPVSGPSIRGARSVTEPKIARRPIVAREPIPRRARRQEHKGRVRGSGGRNSPPFVNGVWWLLCPPLDALDIGYAAWRCLGWLHRLRRDLRASRLSLWKFSCGQAGTCQRL